MRRAMSRPRLQEVIEKVEALTESERELVFEVLRRRAADVGRRRIARDIAEARAAYRKGAVSRGAAADLMREIRAS